MLHNSNVHGNSFTFPLLFKACAALTSLRDGTKLHAQVLQLGFIHDIFVQTSLLLMCSKRFDLVSARNVLDEMLSRNVISWNSMISVYCRGFRVTKAIKLLKVQTSSIHMDCKCGIVEKVEEVFAEVLHKDLGVWSSMINGYAIHGLGNEALNLFHQMQITETFSLDHVVFTSILLACSHSGLVEDGFKYFKDMKRVYRIEPSIEHYTCMVDLLGRAGHFDLALKTIQEIPVQVQAQVSARLLSACRKYRNVDLGEYIARKLLDLNPGNTSNHVLMSNLYTSGGKWKEATITRSMLRNRGLIKEPGWSQVQINGYIRVFVAGDRSHNWSADIYKRLDEFNIKLKEAGCIAEIDMVFHDLENEEKEEALEVHIERLAVAWGPISTDMGTTLTIIKNL
ncbi:hypothetical protein QUC31_017079 [Theobroma cacao]